MELVAEVGRSPEQEEPPHAVREELTGDELPGLLEREALPQGDLLFLLGLGGRVRGSRIVRIILVDVSQFGLVHMLALFRLLIHEGPEEHPDEAQGTDDDEGHFPAELHRERRDAQRRGKRAHGSTGVEDGCRESAVLLREVLGGHLDGRREVAGLAERQDAPAEEEQIDGRRRDGQRDVGSDLDALEGGEILADDRARGPAAGSVQARAGGPDTDGDQVTLLRAHPVHELAREQAGDGVEDGEESGNRTVVVVIPVEFRLDEVLVRERQHLAVQVVDGRRHEQQRAQPPTPVGHQFFLCFTHSIKQLQF